MKPRLNPPDVSAVVPPPPQPPLLWQHNDFLLPIGLQPVQLLWVQEMEEAEGGRGGGEERGSHWPMTFPLPLSVAPDGRGATLPHLSLPVFHSLSCLFLPSLSRLLPPSLQCHRSSSPSTSPLPQWGSSCTSPAWCHPGTCPYASPGTKMASSSCQAPPLAWQ